MNEDSNQLEESPADTTFDCYIHGTSPVKNARSSHRKYFNCILQKKDEAIRVVCFSSQKPTELTTLQVTKIPVRVTNFSKTNTGDINLDNQTKFTPLSNQPFAYSDTLTANGTVLISSLAQVAVEQLVTVKAEGMHVSGVKKTPTLCQRVLSKQEVTIRDPTSSVKVILWGSWVNSLQSNKTYLLQNLRVKTNKNERYLNTAKIEKFLFQEVEPFQVPLAEVDPTNETASITGKIVAVQQVTNTIACITCNKNVVPIPEDDTLGECQGCKLLQTLSSCTSQWYIRVTVQSSTDPFLKRRLTLYNQQVMQPIAALKLELNINPTNERKMTLAILKSNKTLNFSMIHPHIKLQI